MYYKEEEDFLIVFFIFKLKIYRYSHSECVIAFILRYKLFLVFIYSIISYSIEPILKKRS